MQGVPYPVYGEDNLGYSQMMYPGMDYKFPGKYVTEYPMIKNGGGLLNKTLTCPSCGWSWKAVDGGTDIATCHKCGGTAKLAYGGLHKAQAGEEFSDYRRPGSVATEDPRDSFGYMTGKTAAKKSLPVKKGITKTPEEWKKEIRAVEKRIGDPSTWTLDSYKILQDKLNEYKAWRENTPEGKAVVDHHNEPGEYEVQLPSHLKNNKLIFFHQSQKLNL